MTKQNILDQIRRTAKTNDGVPLGRLRFFTETGIKESDWRGIHWVRWNDAVREAGLAPNQKVEPYDDDWLIMKLIALARELGHFPVYSELRIRTRTDADSRHSRIIRRWFESRLVQNGGCQLHRYTRCPWRGGNCKDGEWWNVCGTF